MVDLNAIGFRVKNERLNRVSGSKRVFELGGTAKPDHNQAGHFGFRVILNKGLCRFLLYQ